MSTDAKILRAAADILERRHPAWTVRTAELQIEADLIEAEQRIDTEQPSEAPVWRVAALKRRSFAGNRYVLPGVTDGERFLQFMSPEAARKMADDFNSGRREPRWYRFDPLSDYTEVDS